MARCNVSIRASYIILQYCGLIFRQTAIILHYIEAVGRRLYPHIALLCAKATCALNHVCFGYFVWECEGESISATMAVSMVKNFGRLISSHDERPENCRRGDNFVVVKDDPGRRARSHHKSTLNTDEPHFSSWQSNKTGRIR